MSKPSSRHLLAKCRSGCRVARLRTRHAQAARLLLERDPTTVNTRTDHFRKRKLLPLFQLGSVGLQTQNKVKLWTESGQATEGKCPVGFSSIGLAQFISSRAVTSKCLSGFLSPSLLVILGQWPLGTEGKGSGKTICFRRICCWNLIMCEYLCIWSKWRLWPS